MNDTIYDKGRAARLAGKTKKENPYGRRDWKAQWIAGWEYQDNLEEVGKENDALNKVAQEFVP